MGHRLDPSPELSDRLSQVKKIGFAFPSLMTAWALSAHTKRKRGGVGCRYVLRTGTSITGRMTSRSRVCGAEAVQPHVTAFQSGLLHSAAPRSRILPCGFVTQAGSSELPLARRVGTGHKEANLAIGYPRTRSSQKETAYLYGM